MLAPFYIMFDALAKLTYGIYQIISGIAYILSGFIELIKT
jgi:hypothetical protein